MMTTNNTSDLRRKEVMMKKKNGMMKKKNGMMKHSGKEEMAEMKAMKKGKNKKPAKKAPAKKKGK